MLTANRRRRLLLARIVRCRSGKTFFAMQALRDFGDDKNLPGITLYVKPADLDNVLDTIRLRYNYIDPH